jgi:hypothetical protein
MNDNVSEYRLGETTRDIEVSLKRQLDQMGREKGKGLRRCASLPDIHVYEFPELTVKNIAKVGLSLFKITKYYTTAFVY